MKTLNSVKSLSVNSLIASLKIRKVLPVMLCVLIFAPVFAVVGTVNVDASPIDIEFYQMDLNFDGDITTDSSWGAATIVYEPDGAIMYINLVVNETWVIQNLPLMPVGNEFVLDFDLGVENGTEVTQLEYAYNITTYQLVTMPSDFQIANVTDGSVVMYSGEIGETATFSIPGALIGGLPVDFAWHKAGDIFNQPCGKTECVPAAVSNSLKLLKKKHNLDMKDADISINKMKEATGWSYGGAPVSPDPWWNKKKKYMEDNNEYPIETTIYDETVDLDKIIKEIRRGQDVELRVPGHAAMVTGIIKLANGKYIFGVAHDTKQGPSGNGGEEAQFPEYDPDTKKFTGGKWIDGRKLSRIIVECPEAVGGIVELPQIEEPGAVTPDLSEHNYGALAGIIVGAIVGVIMLISAVWYARRRRTKAM